ncbi:winged helix DNA-binding protein [bacterium]|nr:winged helix DNA-binding protein [bacterium]
MSQERPPSVSLSSVGAAAKRRADHAMENAEDYVEIIEEMQERVGAAHVTDIAGALGVSHVTVHKTLKRLKAMGLIHSEPYRAISLTAEGRKLAIESRERHEVTLRFLLALGLPEEEAVNDAEGIEHHVGAELLARMKFFCDRLASEGTVSQSELGTFTLPEK